MTVTKKPSGVLVPVTTPFDRTNGHIDYAAVHSNAAFLLNAGATGLLAAGSTGEAPLLEDAEVTSLVRELRTSVPDDKWLIVGAGRESTAATVAACRSAREAGADAVLIRAPFYFASAMNEAALLRHFKQVADESPVPVLLYNMPKYTHINLEASLVSALADHQNVIAVKDSSGDIDNFKSYRAATPQWSMLIGSGAAFLDALGAGAVGGILAVANFALRLSLDVLQAFNNSHVEAARTAQRKLSRLHRGIVGALGPPGVKAAMDLVGLSGGAVRPPLLDVTAKERETIAALLDDEVGTSKNCSAAHEDGGTAGRRDSGTAGQSDS